MPNDDSKTPANTNDDLVASANLSTTSNNPNTVTPTSDGVIAADKSPATSDDPFIPPAGNLSNNSSISSDSERRSGQKTIATILGVVLLVAGVAAGVYLVNQQTQVTTKAWDCRNYVFEISEDGVVTVRNGSTRNEPLQSATVIINGDTVATLDVPALEAGDAATLGNVPIPEGGFTWQISGSKDCKNDGKYGPEESPTPTIPQISGQCGAVVTYDSSWNQLNSSELSTLSSGDSVRFAVSGTATSGTFDKARFTINGTLRPEVTNKRPGSEEFYDEYQIPAGTLDFDVKAEIHHSDLGWF